MSGLAKYLLENGYNVAGSDISESKYTKQLKELGATIHIGHKAENITPNSVVVASTAIKETNVEIIKAKELGLQIYHRSDLLAEISRFGKFFIGYAGTHGKTTTSGLASYVMNMANLEPSYVVGGILPEINNNAQCVNGQHFIAELDESDGTIIKYSPNISVINNLEADHLDFYKNGLQSILETFTTFLNGLKTGAKILANSDNEGVKQLIKMNPHKPFITYGLNNNADYVAKNINYNSEYTTFDIYYKGEYLTDLKIILRGEFNVYNALAVLASLNEAGIDINLIKPYFATFSGMGRRFQKIGEIDGITIYDDYAHHPTEIKATLSSTVGMKDKRIVAIFQPHRYTRLQSLWNEFLQSFSNVDKLIVTDVYAASENEIEGVNACNFIKDLKEKFPNLECEHLSGDMQAVADKLYPQLKVNDIVIGLGAGTITELGKKLIELGKGATIGC